MIGVTARGGLRIRCVGGTRSGRIIHSRVCIPLRIIGVIVRVLLFVYRVAKIIGVLVGLAGVVGSAGLIVGVARCICGVLSVFFGGFIITGRNVLSLLLAIFCGCLLYTSPSPRDS